MAKFDKAVEITLKNEGGFVNDKADSGGATNFGISLRFLRTLKPEASVDDIKALTAEDAAKLYRDNFWKYDDISNQLVANKVFDMSVLMGAHQCVHLLQQACGSIVPSAQLKQDGVFGAATAGVVNSIDGVVLLTKFKELLLQFFEHCVTVAPQKGKFLAGWQKRAVQ